MDADIETGNAGKWPANSSWGAQFPSKEAESKKSYKKQDVGQDCHGRDYDDKDRRTKCCFGKIFNMTHRVHACNWMVVIEYGFI